MAIEFPRAPRVSPGDAIASKDLAGLAAAINARLISGLGDPTFRLRYFWLALFRNLRNGSADGFLQPATAEFFERYQMMPPTAGEWPVSGPGDPEGVNVTNPLGCWLYGVDGVSDDEAGALNQVPIVLPDGTIPSTPSEFWALAKLQRGAWDPVTGGTGCPAFDAARYYARVRWPWWQPYGKSYGDWLPTPDESGTACDDPDTSDGYDAPRNLVVFFTGLQSDADTSDLHGTITTNGDGMPVCTYAGTCTPGPSISPSTKYDSHVAGIAEDDLATYVFLWDGTVDMFPRESWIQGPYTGSARLGHTDGQQLARALHAFAREFRGSEQNGWPSDVPSGWNRSAFDAERFFTTQYHLSPQRGSEAMGEVVASYNGGFWLCSWDGSVGTILSGTHATIISGGQTFRVHDECTSTACLITARGLARGCTVQALDGDGNVLASALLEPVGGEAEALLIWPDRADPREITWNLPDGARFNVASGRIDVEATELQSYKPRIWDFFLVTRLGGVAE